MSYLSFPSNFESNFSIDLLRKEMEKVEILNKGIQHYDIEKLNLDKIQSIIDNISLIAKNVLSEYSKNQSGELHSLASEIKEKIQETKKFLKRKNQEKHFNFFSWTYQSNEIIKTENFQQLAESDQLQVAKPKWVSQKELTRKLITSLTNLEHNIEEIQSYGIVVEHFKKESSFPEKWAIFWEKFIHGLFRNLFDALSKNIFIGHQPQVKLSKARKAIGKLEEKRKKESSKLEAMNKKIEELEKDPSKFQGTIKQLSDKCAEVINHIYEIQNEIHELNQEILDIENKLELSKATRKNLHTIGGTNVKIELEDATLDGMYISSDAFRESLKKAGAQTYELTFLSAQNQEKFTLKGLSFPPGAEKNIVIQAIRTLGLFDNAGWQTVHLQDGTTLVITAEEDEKLRRMHVLDAQGYPLDHPEWQVDLKEETWNPAQGQTGGTVLLTSGNAGVYERHKREIVNFLMRGMNVMTFNFRGYGESMGTPTGEGLKRDMEAAFQYLKREQHISDEKIMVKALCMSGGPAADLAAHHPKVNLFIDQSYANFDAIIEDEANRYIDDFVKEHHLGQSALKSLQAWFVRNSRSIVHAMTKLIAPAWSIEKEIGKVKGHVAILLTTRDDMMHLDRDVKKNYQAAMHTKNPKSISIFSIEGKHSDSWVYPSKIDAFIKYSSSEVIDEALKKIPLDLFQGQKYGIDNKTMEKIDLLVAQFPNENSDALKQNLIREVDELERTIKQEIDIEAAIRKQVGELPVQWQEVVRNLLTQVVVPRNPLKELYQDIITFIEENQDTILPGQVNAYIQDEISQLPEPSQELVQTFIHEHIRILELNDDVYLGNRHAGKIQVDQYLKKAHLMGSLI